MLHQKRETAAGTPLLSMAGSTNQVAGSGLVDGATKLGSLPV